jgi:TPP-dependent pyruvate/acetoin dehydrogenase alpha subunit
MSSIDARSDPKALRSREIQRRIPSTVLFSDPKGRFEMAWVDTAATRVGGAEGAFLLRRAGYWLHLTRAVEEAGLRLYKQGRVPGSFYDGRGQEAISVGAALAMREGDVACPLIRDMGVHLVRGVTPETIVRHYLGRSGAPLEGRDGNIHFGSPAHGTIPMISHLPEMIPVALGIALGKAWRGEDAAAIAFCGDGAASAGVWHESLNLASIWRAPLVVLVERNGWAYMTRVSSTLSVERIADRAAGYGIPGLTVDGNDVLAVHDTVAAAFDRARAGGGPSVVEAWSYRMHGHGAHDAHRYVPPEELEEWRGRDPLARWRERARAEAGWTDADEDDLEGAVREEVAEAVARALEAPFPDTAGLGPSVFADA